MYVADAHNSRVQKFDAEGRFLSATGTAGTWQGQFHDPVDVVVYEDGELHVADSGNRRVQFITVGGNFLAEWPLPEQQGEAALARDSKGFLYVSDIANNRIYKLEIVKGVKQ